MTKLPDIELSYHLWTVSDFQKMGEIGILSEKRVELLAGEIVNRSPVGRLHIGAVNPTASLLWQLLGNKAVVSVQNPVVLADRSQPEPDISVLKWNDTQYSDELPQASDVILLIEVADTPLEKDQKLKLPIYAQAGIPEYWIINLVDNTLEQYTGPKGDLYRLRQIYQKEDTLQHALLGEIQISQILL